MNNEPHYELCSINRAAAQRLCFCYIDSTMPLLSKSEISGYAAWFVSYLAGNPEDRFYRNTAQITVCPFQFYSVAGETFCIHDISGPSQRQELQLWRRGEHIFRRRDKVCI